MKKFCTRGHSLPQDTTQRCRECDGIRNNLFYERHRKSVLDNLKADRVRIKTAVFNKLGNRCNNSSCSWVNEDGSKRCTDVRCLQIDHVNDDGSFSGDRKLKSSYPFYKKVLEDTEDRFQLLCANCNWIKRYTCQT